MIDILTYILAGIGALFLVAVFISLVIGLLEWINKINSVITSNTNYVMHVDGINHTQLKNKIIDLSNRLDVLEIRKQK